MAIKYLVCSPGRSGSIFVTLTIAKSLKIRSVMSNISQLPNNDEPIVYHTHDAQLQLDSNIPVLHIVRKNLFAEIISAIICEEYNEWFRYTGNKDPFVADLDRFEEKYFWHKHWHAAHRAMTNYKHRQELSFEEFIGSSETICDQLQIPRVQVETDKSPYSVDNIINIQELRHKFNSLEQQPSPNSWDPEQWKDRRSK